VSVVVYSGRTQSLSPTGQPNGEHAYAAAFFQGQKNVIVRWDVLSPLEEKPPIRKGVWIMDGTLLTPTGLPDPHGYFYRVVNLTDLGTVVSPGNGRTYGFMELELQYYSRAGTPTNVPDLQGFPASPSAYPAPCWGRLVVLENVVEVFDRGLEGR
jgi:hypothetical protein